MKFKKNLIVKNIPEEMKTKSNWVCHKNKVPVSANGTGNASCSDTSTWTDFETAVTYAEANGLGLGYQLVAQDGIVGIDIDHCYVNGKIKDTKIMEILTMANSYMEFSPSETGIHIFVKGIWDVQNNRHRTTINDNIGIEVYAGSRYFTVTGNKLSDAPSVINEAQGVLDYIAKEFFTEQGVSSVVTHNAQQDSSQQLNEAMLTVIREELLKNPSFASLWNGERTNSDESSNDFALICALLRIFDGDKDQARLAFLASNYVATKDDKHIKKLFERDDYLERTFEVAARAVENGDKLPSDYALLQYLDNDAGNADKFLHLFGNNIRFCVREKQWYVYSDNHWHADEDGEIKVLQEQLYSRFMVVARKYDKERMGVAEKLGNYAKRNSMLQAAEVKCTIHSNEFDQHNHFLTASNGVIDLRNGKLLEFSPEYLLRQRTEVAYNPDAPEPTRFLQFLDEIFLGDQGLKEYCLRLLGYWLTGENREQNFYILHGKGANGKSVLVNLLRWLFKDITAFLAQDAFLLKNTNSSNPSLYGARFSRICFVNETNRNDALNTALIKALSGGDVAMVRTLFKEHVDLQARFKIVFVTNHLPNMDWNDTAILRRVKIIPFNRIFTKEEQDNKLLEKLYEESEGILKILVNQAVRYYNEGMSQEPHSLGATLKAVRREDDSVYAFLNDMLERTHNNGDRIQARPLYDRYCAYCNLEALSQVSEVVFAKKMAALGIESLKTVGCKNYTGLKYRVIEQDGVDTVA